MRIVEERTGFFSFRRLRLAFIELEYQLPDVSAYDISCPSFPGGKGCFATEAMVWFLLEFRRQRIDAASGVFELSVA